RCGGGGGIGLCRNVSFEQVRGPQRRLDRFDRRRKAIRECNVLEALANSAYADWVNASWGWPLALTIHAFGTAIVVGFMAIIGLRLLGLFPTIPYASLNKLIPLIWIAVVFQALSGFTLWVTKPAQYLADGMFEVKFTLVVVSIVVMAYFAGTLKREAPAWD